MKKFLSRLRRIITKLLIDPGFLDSHINRRIWHETNAFRWASAYVTKNQISGDYLEFGVWKGNSFIEFYNQIEAYSEMFYGPGGTLRKSGRNIPNMFKDMRFHAFDSFEGLSKPSSGNESIQYFEGNYKAEETLFRERLQEAKIDLSRVTITKGWFSDTLTQKTAKKLNIKDIAICYIDCDLIEPAKSALNFITPYLKTGSILIFDDWFRNKGYTNQGIQGAALDWLAENKNIFLQHYYNSDTRTVLFIVQMDGSKKDFQINSV